MVTLRKSGFEARGVSEGDECKSFRTTTAPFFHHGCLAHRTKAREMCMQIRIGDHRVQMTDEQLRVAGLGRRATPTATAITTATAATVAATGVAITTIVVTVAFVAAATAAASSISAAAPSVTSAAPCSSAGDARVASLSQCFSVTHVDNFAIDFQSLFYALASQHVCGGLWRLEHEETEVARGLRELVTLDVAFLKTAELLHRNMQGSISRGGGQTLKQKRSHTERKRKERQTEIKNELPANQRLHRWFFLCACAKLTPMNNFLGYTLSVRPSSPRMSATSCVSAAAAAAADSGPSGRRTGAGAGAAAEAGAGAAAAGASEGCAADDCEEAS
jgi:hypothetical protein